MIKSLITFLVIVTILVFASACAAQSNKTVEKELNKADSILIARMLLLSSQVDSLGVMVSKKIDYDHLEKTYDRLHNDISLLRSDLNSEILRLSNIHEQVSSKTTDELNRLTEIVQQIENQVAKLQTNIAMNYDSILALGNNMLLTKAETGEQIDEVNNMISIRIVYVVLSLIALLLLIVLSFFIIRVRQTKQKNALSSKISETREMLDKEGVKLDTKLVSILKQRLDNEGQQVLEKGVPDHALPLKLSEEIHRIKKRLTNMDSTHDVKVLRSRIEALEQLLNKQGYEIINLEGRPYIDGMNVRARFIVDDKLEEGQEIITRVIIPQVNYKDVLIQAAEVEINRQG